MIQVIKAATLNEWLKNDDVYLLDVREPFEYQQISLEAATLVPLAQVSREVLPAEVAKVVILCRSGARSMTACELLQRQDPSLELYNLEGGILAWSEAGYPVSRGL